MSPRIRVLIASIAIIAIPALSTVAVLQSTSAVDACSITWDGPNNPTLTAVYDGTNFGGSGAPFEMSTSTILYSGESAFDLYLQWSSGGSTNIFTCTVSPAIFLGVGTTSSSSHLTGSLSNGCNDGTIAVAAWNNNNPTACSSTHYRTVTENDPDC